jgi:hypothetical protein
MTRVTQGEQERIFINPQNSLTIGRQGTPLKHLSVGWKIKIPADEAAKFYEDQDCLFVGRALRGSTVGEGDSFGGDQ